jgi:hypothetical protein
MARRRGSGPSPAWSRLRSPALAGALMIGMLVGCTYGAEEPGLFGREPEPTDAASEVPQREWPVIEEEGRRSNTKLPVIGEEIWTSGDGMRLTVRIAVHAVRRTSGATVLDWSVTPLGAPGLGPNDVVPASIDLGLHRFDEGNTNVFLVDSPGERLYRPLVHRDLSRRCLCTSVWRAQRSLQIGRTSLLQTAYPELPPQLTRVDVDIASVPMFTGVPVTPVGLVPLPHEPVDLTRPPDASDQPRGAVLAGRLNYHGQRFQVRIERVLASATNTSLEWTLRSLDPGAGLEEASLPPFADPIAPITYNTIAASGPRLRVGERVLRTRLVTSTLTARGTVECLCSDLRIWARALRSPGQEATVVTNLPALPEGARGVDVVLPGHDAKRVAVTPVADAALRAGPQQRLDVGTWAERNWPRGWNSFNWPTRVPSRDALTDYVAVTDRLLG